MAWGGGFKFQVEWLRALRAVESCCATVDRFKPLNLSTNQPFNLSILQPINPSTNQPFNPSTSQPINPSTSQPINLSTNQPFNQSTAALLLSTNQPIMSRIKKGLDYYSFPTDTFHDLRIKRLRRKCRNNGMLVCLYLITEVYRTNGYYVPVSEELVMDTAEYFYLTEEEVKTIIHACCTEGVFDHRLYKQYQILTSAELQERYAEVCVRLRRSTIPISSEHLLIPEPKPYQRNKPQVVENKSTEVVDGATQTEDVSFQCPSISTQKKRNEKKGNENKPHPIIPSPESGKGEEAMMEEKKEIPLETQVEILPNPGTPCPRGEGRNYAGLVEALQRLRIEVKDINAILQLSNFGEVGDPVWQALYAINNAPPGTFRQPVKYIYSIIQKHRKVVKGGVSV